MSHFKFANLSQPIMSYHTRSVSKGDDRVKYAKKAER